MVLNASKKAVAVAGDRLPSRFLSAHVDAHGRAPQAGLRRVHAVDRLVCPLGRRGGKQHGVSIIGRGADGQEHKTLAVTTVHPDFATGQEEAETLPAPFDHHLPAHEQDMDEGHQHGQVRPHLYSANDAQFDGEGVVAFAAGLDRLDAGQDADEGAGFLRDDAVRQQRGGVGVERQDVGAGAVLGGVGGLRAAQREFTHRIRPMLEDVDQPEAVCHNGGHLGGGQTQNRGPEGDFIGVIPEPGHLAGNVAGITILMFHVFVCFSLLFVCLFVVVY